MKTCAFAVILLIGSFSLNASGEEVNPIAKIISMIAELQQKVIKEGEESHKMYEEFSEMCEDRAGELHNEIKTGKEQVQALNAVIDKATADRAVLEEKISSFAASISEGEADLKQATGIRNKEKIDFQAEEKELVATTSTIERSITIIEREMAGGASFAQVKGLQSVTSALQTMVEAHSVSTADGATLMALVQSSSETDEDDQEDQESLGAPAAAAYKGQSGTITETLDALLEKSEKQLSDARNAEKASSNAYEMEKQSLEDKVKFAKQELAEAKKGLAATKETKATAEGDLESTQKDLAEDKKELESLHRECLTEATSYEESTSSRGEELKALAEAKKIIQATTGDAASQTYLTQTSFVQVAAKAKSRDGYDAVSMAVDQVRHLAMTQSSDALVQFASRLERAARSKADPFGKVKKLINGMIDKLMDEADAEATKKAYCDKEMGETQVNQDDKESQLEQLTTQIDVMSSASKKLKGEVGVLQKELGALARTTAQMDKLRMEQKAQYDKNKPELEMGLNGVKKALKVLREYYAKDDDKDDSAGGGATGIIGLLEVCESDFSKGLAEIEAEEQAAVKAYTEASQENEVAKATKTQDAKYKKKEYLSLDKNIAELQADKSGVSDELSAVNEYFAGIKKQCVAQPDSYEETVKRRNKEIAGLKDGLATLEGEAVLLQRSAVRKTLRGPAVLRPAA